MLKKLFILTSLLALFSPALAGEMPYTAKELAEWKRLQGPFHFWEMPGVHLQPIRNPDVTASIKTGMILEACSEIKDLEGNILYFGYIDSAGIFHEYLYDFETRKFEESLFTNEQEDVLRKMCSQCHPFKYPICKREDG